MIKAEEVDKKAKVKAEVIRKRHAEESMKLASTLVETENLMNEVHLSQSELASLTKRVNTSDAH